MPTLSPIFRLSIGLILLTVSLLLIGDLLGLTPDQKRAELASRKAIAEALAIQVSSDVSAGHVNIVRETLQTLQERNDQVLSIGLRSGDGRLIAMAGDHVASWIAPDKDVSTSSHVLVPIHGGDSRWGSLEISFESLDGSLLGLFNGGSITTVILFIAMAGFVAYWLFLKRALSELDPSAVVPDRVHAALDVLAEGLVILDRNERIVLANAAFERKLGHAARTLVGNELSSIGWSSASDHESKDHTLPWLTLLSSGQTPPPTQLKLQTSLKEMLTFTVNVSPVKAPDGGVRGAVVTFDDLTELEKKHADLENALGRLEHSQREITRQNRELQVLATRDPLTGSLNRRSLFEGMGTLVSEAAEEGEPLSCIMVDIDHFKSINDRFGHATGDKVIKLLARILTDSARAEDLIGRYGGEEFCVVLPGVGEDGAFDVAERMRLAVYEGKSARFTSALRISASFGVSTDLDGKLTPSALVDLADKALYQAKESGRNRVVRWSEVEASGEVMATVVKPVTATDQKSASTDVSSLEMQDASVSDVRPEELQVLRSRVLELETLIQERRITDESDSGGASMLASRVVLVDRISQASHRSRRAGTKVAVMAVDIDIVRTLMTTRGNSPAEKLTRLVASRLKKTLRSTDTISLQGADEIEFSVSRTGAGEFVVLLTDIQDSECTTWIAKRLFDALEDPVDVEGDEILLDASIGLSLYPTDGEDPDLLLSNAAAAMREARVAQGRHVCLFYCKEMNQRSKRQLEMETQLHHAIERSEMFLEYQPGIDLQTGRIANFEALLRWRHPKWGMVRPDEFIPVAEHAGLIEDIGVWVFRSAMRQLKAWNDAGFDHLSVAINFSAIQFRDESLVDTLVETIHDVGVAAESVVIEITESALIQSLETAVKIVDGLSAAGVRIALDDFGTGYSSLSYLKRFAIDVVKIDRSFLADFPSQAHDTEIVSAIIAMSHSLGLRVVAEGVEEDRQLQVLQNLNCDEIQGYVFSKPVPRDRATALLTSPTDFRRRVRAAGENSIRGLSLKESPMSGVLNEAPRRGAAG